MIAGSPRGVIQSDAAGAPEGESAAGGGVGEGSGSSEGGGVNNGGGVAGGVAGDVGIGLAEPTFAAAGACEGDSGRVGV
jgi:hypothetical protein